ncbi:hypothetical protein GCM10010912_22000 [Paenibacillus albidus]|uniref:Accessory regulator AgrB n=1 Tax=Paenibacillus albidus TaxID=2041023 RepID=A0A917C8A2_9BACL|nr:accessory gene regulator B family protein [Paenibacillus albidus]GGF76512.1 hypothetical protein GCM10010912_22000 [Paenibacillus albidus]
MNLIANRIAATIKKANPEETHSLEIMQYALVIILNTLSIVLLTFGIGLITGNLVDSLSFLFCFSTLRFLSGGFHLAKSRDCIIVSVLISTVIPHFFILTEHWLLITNALSVLIMLMFAPNPDRNAQIPKKFFPYLKVISLVLVCTNFFLDSSVVGLAFFAQSVTIIPWKRR